MTDHQDLIDGVALAVSDRDRFRAALTLISIPPHGRDVGCAGCAEVAQRALNGHDFRPEVAALGDLEDL